MSLDRLLSIAVGIGEDRAGAEQDARDDAAENYAQTGNSPTLNQWENRDGNTDRSQDRPRRTARAPSIAQASPSAAAPRTRCSLLKALTTA